MKKRKAWTGSIAAMALLAGAAAHADEVRYLPHAEQGLAQYLGNIESAQSSINAADYIWDPCSIVGRVALRALENKKKADPKVKIRLILDGSLHTPLEQAQLTTTYANRGVELRFFNNTTYAKDLRMHIKFTEVDGKKVITGGRNIADDYYSLSGGANWVDREAEAEGPAAAEAARGFNALWNYQLTKPAARSATPEEAKAFESKCLKPDATVLAVERYFAANGAAILQGAPIESCPNTKMTTDSPDFLDGGGPAWQRGRSVNDALFPGKATTNEIYATFAAAQKNLEIENYTYIPIDNMASLLKRYRTGKGVSVKVITNEALDEGQAIMQGPANYFEHADNAGSERIFAIPKGRMIQDDWALTPKNSAYQIHAKTAVVDGRDAIVSSFNMDGRSLEHNLESALVVKGCPAFARQVSGAIDETYDRAERILASPAVQRCIQRTHSAPGGLNNLLGWIAEGFL